MTDSNRVRVRVRRRRPAAPQGSILKRVSIEGLFGKYTYANLDFSHGLASDKNVSVLIGDNGSGKTTILRLVYAALSPEAQAGWRTYIAQTPFLRMSIALSSGQSVVITKSSLVGSFVAKIAGTGSRDGEYSIQADTDGTIRSRGQLDQLEGLHAALRDLNIDILFIDHTRKIRSTYELLSAISISESDPSRSWRGLEFIAPDDIRERPRTDLVEFPLVEIIAAVHEWFRVRAFRQGTTGEQDASSVYLEVVRTLSKRRKAVPMEPQTPEELKDELDDLNDQTEPYIRHGLLSRYPFGELREIINSAHKTKVPQIQSVLAPFLTSIRRRIDALSAVQSLISIYEEELNQYFRDKIASFHVLEGLTISDNSSGLSPESLSSGERQLVFLLSAAILARDGRSLIMIDEPELSLNYKWQRLIASSLSRMASNSDTQFVLASHSIEIISRHVDSVVEL